MNVNANTLAAPAWAGDPLSRDYLVPGGAKIDAAAFAADSAGRKPVPSGTVVGRTLAERDANGKLGPAADTDEEFFIVAFDVTDAAVIDDVELARPFAGLTVRENFLPDIATLSAAVKTAVRARYVCVVGRD